jgi:cobalt-zinc-cadmium efflux system protein
MGDVDQSGLFGDAAGLALAWCAAWMASQAPTERHTFGWRRATQLSPLFNAVLLVGFSGALLWEALGRFQNPPQVPGVVVMAVAGLGILVNLGTAALFLRGQKTDLNKRGAYLHLLADAAVSLAGRLSSTHLSKMSVAASTPTKAGQMMAIKFCFTGASCPHCKSWCGGYSLHFDT